MTLLQYNWIGGIALEGTRWTFFRVKLVFECEFKISWSLGPLNLGTLGPLDSWTPSLLQHFLILPLTSSYLLLSLPPTLLLWYGLVMGGGGVVNFEDEIGDGPLKSCGVGGWNPGTSSFFLHSIPLSSSHLLLIPPSYSTLLPNLLLTPPTSS